MKRIVVADDEIHPGIAVDVSKAHVESRSKRFVLLDVLVEGSVAVARQEPDERVFSIAQAQPKVGLAIAVSITDVEWQIVGLADRVDLVFEYSGIVAEDCNAVPIGRD